MTSGSTSKKTKQYNSVKKIIINLRWKDLADVSCEGLIIPAKGRTSKNNIIHLCI